MEEIRVTKINQKWLNWREIVISDQSLSFGEKALGLYLNTYMNGKQDFAFPSIATICGEMNLGSNKTAIKYLSGLAEKGYLIKEKRYGNSIIYHTSFPEKILSSVNATLLEEIHDSSVRGTPTVVYEVHTNNQMNKQINKQEGRSAPSGSKKPRVFVPPDLSEVTTYVRSIGSHIDPQEFIDHYEANGWFRGKTKIKNWKACVRTWESKRKKANGGTKPAADNIFAI